MLYKCKSSFRVGCRRRYYSSVFCLPRVMIVEIIDEVEDPEQENEGIEPTGPIRALGSWMRAVADVSSGSLADSAADRLGSGRKRSGD